MNTEHAVFRVDPDCSPKWSYYSTPNSCVGGADSLADARVDYRGALAFLLDVDDSDLPVVVEHNERELVPGVWLRIRRDENVRDREAAFDILAAVLHRDPEIAVALARHPAAGGDVIVVSSQPDDLMSSFHDELNEFDSVWIATSGVESVTQDTIIGWVAFARDLAEGIDPALQTSLKEMGIDATTTTLAEFLKIKPTGGVLATKLGAQINVPVMV